MLTNKNFSITTARGEEPALLLSPWLLHPKEKREPKKRKIGYRRGGGGNGKRRDLEWKKIFFIKFPSVPNPRTDFVGKTAVPRTDKRVKW